MSTSTIRREVVFDETVPCDLRIDRLDGDWLRRRFSTLFDRAATAICRAGYDLDDAVIERAMTCCVGDRTVTVAVGFSSESSSLLAGVRTALAGASDEPVAPDSVIVSGLNVRAIVERWA